MIHSRLALLSSTVLLLGAPLTGLAQTAVAVDTTATAVDKLFDRWRGSNTPGCAVGVNRNGRIVLERGYGMANLETATPITPSTIFHAASLAKQVTAMAVMLLVQDGKLSLDDDVRRFVPELPDYGTRITVRHLLTHTSGLRDFFEMLILARGRFEENRITQADMMDIVSRQRVLNFTPGKRISLQQHRLCASRRHREARKWTIAARFRRPPTLRAPQHVANELP